MKDEFKELESTLVETILKEEMAINPLLKWWFVENIKKLEKEVELKEKQLNIDEKSIYHSLEIYEGTSSNGDKRTKLER